MSIRKEISKHKSFFSGTSYCCTLYDTESNIEATGNGTTEEIAEDNAWDDFKYQKDKLLANEQEKERDKEYDRDYKSKKKWEKEWKKKDKKHMKEVNKKLDAKFEIWKKANITEKEDGFYLNNICVVKFSESPFYDSQNDERFRINVRRKLWLYWSHNDRSFWE